MIPLNSGQFGGRRPQQRGDRPGAFVAVALAEQVRWPIAGTTSSTRPNEPYSMPEIRVASGWQTRRDIPSEVIASKWGEPRVHRVCARTLAFHPSLHEDAVPPTLTSHPHVAGDLVHC
jgi:hypothetical protein